MSIISERDDNRLDRDSDMPYCSACGAYHFRLAQCPAKSPPTITIITTHPGATEFFRGMMVGGVTEIDLGALGKDWHAKQLEINPTSGGFVAKATLWQMVKVDGD